MLQKLHQFKAKHPFTSLMFIAIAIRILVVIFVPGFGSNHDLQQPTLIQQFLEWLKRVIGMGNSQWMMFLSRMFYAIVSLFTVSKEYRLLRDRRRPAALSDLRGPEGVPDVRGVCQSS